MKKKLCSILACVCLLTGNIAYANGISVSEITQASLVTDTNVKVVKYVGDEEVIVYTGPVSQYDNGLCSGVDFSKSAFIVALEWENPDAVYYVYPITSTPQSNAMASVSQNEKDGVTSEQINTAYENVVSDEEGIAFSSQIKINGVNTSEAGLRVVDNAQLQCSFDVTNSTNAEKDITLLLATYDDDKRMVNVKKSDVKVPANLSGNISLVYQFNAETEKNAKLMLWHSGIMPVRVSVNFDGESGVNAYYYDTNNRLVQIDKMNGKSIFYTYDNMGNLLSKTVNGGEEDA